MIEHILCPDTILGSFHVLYYWILSPNLEVATVIVFILFYFVLILEIRKMKLREEKSSDLPKVTQLVNVELNLISWVLKPTLVTTRVKERSWQWGIEIWNLIFKDVTYITVKRSFRRFKYCFCDLYIPECQVPRAW